MISCDENGTESYVFLTHTSNKLKRSNGVVIEGFMQKRSSWRRSWKKRYFVLESNGRLSYFKSEEDRSCPDKSRGKIPISNDTSVEESESGSGKVSINISPPSSIGFKRIVTISALNDSDHKSWLDKLQSVQHSVCYVSMLEL